MPKRPTQSQFFSENGRDIGIHPDEIYADNHRYVRQHPEWFQDVQLITDDRPVEQATASPGERRTTRR